MRSVIRWAIANKAAVNTLVIGVIVAGVISLFSLRRETFPEFELEVVLVTVPYPGADPDEVETAICQKIEEAVGSIADIKTVTSIAQENLGSVVMEIDPGVADVQKILNEIRGEVDRISTFPEQAEDAEVKQLTFRDTAIRLAVMGPEDASPEAQLRLREVAERVRDELLQLPDITQADIQGAREYEIDIEIPEETLRRYGLSLQEVARVVRRENLDLPGGLLKSPSQDVMLKGENKRVLGAEIEKIPLVTDPGGVVLTVGDVATVKDEFADTASLTRVNGRPALVVAVQRTSDEDLIEVTDEVKEFAENPTGLPAGYSLMPWDDHSEEVKDRIRMLSNDGWQALVLVFIALSLFLDLRLAFWVAAGIPIALLGTCIILLATGQTLNMLSLFGLLIVMGILVDDAIVISENVHVHREMGKSPLQAAIDGTAEVAVSVAASVATTVIAFLPLLFVSGVMGKFIAVLPVAVIACLVISLVETTSTLPMHLAHEPHGTLLTKARVNRQRMSPVLRWTLGLVLVAGAALIRLVSLAFAPIAWVLRRLNPKFSAALDAFIERAYAPVLRGILARPALAICSGIAFLLLTVGGFAGGFIRYQFFPDLDSNLIQATVTFPDGTPEEVTARAVARLSESLDEIDAKYAKDGLRPVKVKQESIGYVGGQNTPDQRSQSTGSHLGQVQAQLVDPSLRGIKSVAFVNAWRETAKEFAGAESVSFESPSFGPQGRKIEFKLVADREHAADLELAAEAVKAKLAGYAGVFDVDDDSRPGKAELRVDLKPNAVALGVQRADLFETVRAAYFGEEVMRVQRGRHEIKVMARLPEEDRRSFADFDDLRVRTADPEGGLIQRPITELADVSIGRGPSEINRIDRLRSVTVYSDVDEAVASTRDIVTDLKASAIPAALAAFPNVKVLWKGQAEQESESIGSMFLGVACAMVGMFALLTLEFKSYLQPLLILMIIPFGLAGAMLGHGAMGIPVSFFSIMGMVALTGIVVNDSIVLVDFINLKLSEGLTLNEAIYEAGVRRFRPVVLNSVTSCVGLLPMLTETSYQAQVLIPMACSIFFGLMTTTGLVLVLLPAVYSAYGSLVGLHGVSGGGRHDPEPHDAPVDRATYVREPDPRPEPVGAGA